MMFCVYHIYFLNLLEMTKQLGLLTLSQLRARNTFSHDIVSGRYQCLAPLLRSAVVGRSYSCRRAPSVGWTPP